MNIVQFLSNNNIIINSEVFIEKRYYTSSANIKNQMQLIAEAQKSIMGEKGTIIPRIESTIGRQVEGFKVDIKRNIRVIDEIKNRNKKNDFDYMIIDAGEKIINRAEKCLAMINKDLYYRLIKRSMVNYEMCFGRSDEGSLINDSRKNIFYLRTDKYISYNMIEHDCFNYLRKIKKRSLNINMEEMINVYILAASLNEDSKRYLMILCNYPFEGMKVLSKIRANKIIKGKEQWIDDFKIAEINDGNELL